jgi:hypothetical protein
MFKLLEVKALPDYKLRLRYTDGTEGEVDLSDFAGRGVFKLWNDYSAFEGVYIGAQGQIAWSDEIDMCPDALYLRLTEKRPEEVFPNLSEMGVDA